MHFRKTNGLRPLGRNVAGSYPNHTVDFVGRLQTPVFGLYGGQDDAISLATIQQMQAALKEGSDEARRSEIRIYPEAEHAFFADYPQPTKKSLPWTHGASVSHGCETIGAFIADKNRGVGSSLEISPAKSACVHPSSTA